MDLPELDLPPGDYRERKPKGWRWKLPLNHDDDAKVPFFAFCIGVGIVGFILANLPEGTSFSVVAFTSGMAFCAGGAFVLWTRR